MVGPAQHPAAILRRLFRLHSRSQSLRASRHSRRYHRAGYSCHHRPGENQKGNHRTCGRRRDAGDLQHLSFVPQSQRGYGSRSGVGFDHLRRSASHHRHRQGHWRRQVRGRHDRWQRVVLPDSPPRPSHPRQEASLYDCHSQSFRRARQARSSRGRRPRLLRHERREHIRRRVLSDVVRRSG